MKIFEFLYPEVTIMNVKKKLHDKLSWVYLVLKSNKDNRCQFCDDRIAQDSTGDWFHLSKE